MKKSLLLRYLENTIHKPNKLKVLPLFHSCEGYVGKQIIANGELRIRRCETFEKDLLYFFYGKPSYPILGKKNRTDVWYCPVSFIVNPQKVKIYKVFPFDTGAFKRNMYEDFIHSKMQLCNYELYDINSILEYILVMFANNKNYLNGVCVKENDETMEIKALLNLLNAKGTFSIDERANTVEIISDMNLKLKGAIECIILPQPLLRVKEIKEFVEANGIEVRSYNVRRLTAPDRYNEVVFQLAMKYINTSLITKKL